MADWTERWMSVARLVATWSKDKSRKTGCVIVDERNAVLAVGWNGFPRGANDNDPARYERPAKYKYTEHAERNAIYNAASRGIPILGSTIYVPWYPCCDCARAIIQTGISRLVCVEPDWNDEVWADDFAIVKTLLSESPVSVQMESSL